MHNKKKSKNIIAIIVVVLAVLLIFVGKQLTKSYINEVKLEIEGNSLNFKLKPINFSNLENVKGYSIPSSKIESLHNILYETQSSFILEFDTTNNNITSNGYINVGLIYRNEEYEKINYEENAVHVVLKNAPNSFRIALAYNPEMGNMLGFYICTTEDLNIKSAKVIPTILGFDKSLYPPVYGFSSTGGDLDFSLKNINFSNAEKDFPDMRKANYIIKLNKNAISTLDNEVYADIFFKGEKIRVKNVDKESEIIIPCSSLEYPYSKISIVDNMNIIDGVLLSTSIKKEYENKYYPIKTEPGLILNYNIDNWRNENFEIYRWDRFPNILFVDTKDYETQSKFFSRLAYFVEKKDFKGKILTNEQLKGKHGYNAHDYSFKSIALFYNKAYDKNVLLTKEELLLREILLDNNYLELSPDNKHVLSTNGAIASISRESSPWLRKLFLSHEGMHTLFFTKSEFRDYVSKVYVSTEPKARSFLINYFDSQSQLGYDTKDEFLMLNEFMAYLIQQPVREVSKYFVRLANSQVVRNYTPMLSRYVIETNASDFENAAKNINDFIFYNYGIVGGNLCLTTK